jgi:beta-N-acetylhexosaminidase
MMVGQTNAPDLDQLVAAMSPEEQVGQLILGHVPGATLDAATAATLRDCHLGGAVLFARNFSTADGSRALIAQIQELAGRPGLPAIVAIDQEGGRVQRLLGLATSFPSAMAFGAAGDAEHARRWGVATGRALRSLGVNTDFAPALDVNNNPANPVIGTRSYGERPEEVARLGVAALTGLREGGVVATVKHFPGHGDTSIDSHADLPAIPHDLARLRAVELVPFQAAIAAGVPAVMSAHIVFPALDPSGLPATLSRAVLTDFLRGELGFTGLVVSDAMDMQAVAARWGVPNACARFVAAGGDLLEPLREERAVHAAIVAAVRAGTIPAAQLAASVKRILHVKSWIAAQGPADPAWLDAPEHRAWATAVARDALTLLRAEAGVLPLRRDAQIAVLDLLHDASIAAEPTARDHSLLADALRPRFPRVTVLVLDGKNLDVARAEAAIAHADVVVIGTRGASRLPAQAAFVNALPAHGKPVVAVALTEPYDAIVYPTVPTVFATYGAEPSMLEALSAALAGETTARGRLPVTLPAA